MDATDDVAPVAARLPSDASSSPGSTAFFLPFRAGGTAGLGCAAGSDSLLVARGRSAVFFVGFDVVWDCFLVVRRRSPVLFGRFSGPFGGEEDSGSTTFRRRLAGRMASRPSSSLGGSGGAESGPILTDEGVEGKEGKEGVFSRGGGVGALSRRRGTEDGG